MVSCSGGSDGVSGLKFEALPYALDALEPHIDAETMKIHYEQHHRAYFDRMKEAVKGTAFANRSLETLLAQAGKLPDALRNNAGGHYNHAFFWKSMSPDGGGVPQGRLAERIDQDFGSFERMQQAFNGAALSRFGSGWAWLCVDANGSLFVTSTPNQDNPLMDTVKKRGTPILGLDVWEHAYYLQYQSGRGHYIDAFWHVVNWPEVAERLERIRNKA
ncbi:superoxide dismutase [Desulfobotulus sp. H1]|uniref:Superoxide dismutase n=2 Tax=Desulfobotulus pelophilus TaxID=2823377 RepID=A0ABT3N9Y7_9BACT|nr:superoxide dismutase [Desulfobotulus pelophilus]